MTTQVSRLLRAALKDRFVYAFNGNLAEACAAVKAPAFVINFTGGEPQNFYESPFALNSLLAKVEPTLPALGMWTGEGVPYGPGLREMPCNWHGAVRAYWRFFLLAPGMTEDDRGALIGLREAVESAMIATLAPELSEVTYRGDLGWDRLDEIEYWGADETQIGWVQEVNYSATFEVRA
jgi:hypothetical protein